MEFTSDNTRVAVPQPNLRDRLLQMVGEMESLMDQAYDQGWYEPIDAYKHLLMVKSDLEEMRQRED